MIAYILDKIAVRLHYSGEFLERVGYRCYRLAYPRQADAMAAMRERLAHDSHSFDPASEICSACGLRSYLWKRSECCGQDPNTAA